MNAGTAGDTASDWGTLYTILNSSTTFGMCNQANTYDRAACTLKIPFSGNRFQNNGSFGNQGANGLYWSSSPY